MDVHYATMPLRSRLAARAQEQQEKQNHCSHDFVKTSQRPARLGLTAISKGSVMLVQRHCCPKCSKQVTTKKRVALNA